MDLISQVLQSYHHSPSTLKISPMTTRVGVKTKLSLITNKLPNLNLNNSPARCIIRQSSNNNLSSLQNIPGYLNINSAVNISKPKEISLLNQINENVSERNIITDIDSVHSKKSSKSQPKVSRNLPAVFLNDVNKKIIFKKVASKEKGELSRATEASTEQLSINIIEKKPDSSYYGASSVRKNSSEKKRSILTPLRPMPFVLENHTSYSQLSSSPLVDKHENNNTRKKIIDKILKNRIDTLEINPKLNFQVNPDGQKLKQLVISKKLQDRVHTSIDNQKKYEVLNFDNLELSPNNNNKSNANILNHNNIELKSQLAGNSHHCDNPIQDNIATPKNFLDALKQIEVHSKHRKNFSLISPYMQENNKIKFFDMEKKLIEFQLSEFVTLKKVKNTINNGTLKRMFHVPTCRIFDILEESVKELKPKENLIIRDWIDMWKHFFNTNKNLVKVYASFWNSPEGCISVLLEPSRKNFLSDILASIGGLPESCIQTIAYDIAKGLHEIHKTIKGPHGFISPSEIALDSYYRVKLFPSISCRMSHEFTHKIHLLKRYEDNNHVETKQHYHKGIFFAKNHYNSFQKTEPIDNPPNKFENLSKTFSTAHDIFDLGLTLLQCALMPLDLYTTNDFFNKENLNFLIENLPNKNQLAKGICCLLHSEEQLKKITSMLQNELSRSFLMNDKTQSPVKNNFNYPSRFVSISTTKRSEITLLEALKSQNRFSESFIDFLCTCLKIDPDQRVSIDMLLSHEFLSQNHQNHGPAICLSELMRLENDINPLQNQQNKNSVKSLARPKDGSPYKKSDQQQQQLEKFMEALKIVLMNKEVKQKFENSILKKTTTTTPSIDEKKLASIAKELDISIKRLYSRITGELIFGMKGQDSTTLNEGWKSSRT